MTSSEKHVSYICSARALSQGVELSLSKGAGSYLPMSSFLCVGPIYLLASNF